MSINNLPKLDLYRRIVQAKLFIDSNYAERIDAGEIADEACYSKFHFIRTFKSIYGRTPHQYLTHVRIERAKELLEQGVSVTEACFAVGFDSLGSFTSLFKRRAGVTPSEYQRRQLERKAEIKKEPLRFIPGCFAALFVGQCYFVVTVLGGQSIALKTGTTNPHDNDTKQDSNHPVTASPCHPSLKRRVFFLTTLRQE